MNDILDSVKGHVFLELVQLLRYLRLEIIDSNLKSLFLTCNEIDSFTDVQRHLGTKCPSLACLSLSECPIADVPAISGDGGGLSSLVSLNVNMTKIADWSDVDNFRTFPSLQELRIRGTPLMEEYTAHERRSLLVARYTPHF